MNHVSISSLPAVERERILNGPYIAPPEEVTPNFVNPSNSNAACRVVTSLCLFSTTILVLTRLYTKFILIRQTKIEDYLIVAAYGTYVGMTYWLFKMATGVGFRVHGWDIRLKDSSGFLYAGFVYIGIYSVHIILSKTAILLDWIHTFVPGGTRNFFSWVCHCLLWFNILFYTSIAITMNLSCSPRALSWDATLEGTCINTTAFFIISSAINLASDIFILVLPQLVIWSLNIPKQKKIGVSIVFAIGILTITTSCFRVVAAAQLQHSADTTFILSEFFIWTHIEITCLASIICIPTVPRAWNGLGLPSATISRLWFKTPARPRTSVFQSGHPRAHTNRKKLSNGMEYREINTISFPLVNLQSPRNATTRSPAHDTSSINAIIDKRNYNEISIEISQSRKFHSSVRGT